MIQGTVSSNLDLAVRVIFIGPEGQSVEVDAFIDTGFDGALTLPRDVISKLGLTIAGDATITLADGSLVEHDVFSASVLWDSQTRRVFVTEVESEPLIGTKLLSGFELLAQFTPNGRFTIRKP
jgi:clan AA aspartic protease